MEIMENSVVASHGLSIGTISNLELNYLRSRGVSLKNAKKILIRAFVR